MSSPDPRRRLQSYRDAREALKRKTRKHGLKCWLCGEGFDWTLHPSDRMAWTADHIVPLAKGGHITGPLRPAHRSCNSKRGKADKADRLPTTRTW